ncbi:hypothetical protein N0V93_008498 [Gnomoniopsis smithogilvyi]|uniref:Uncharacterized protein n=1 Tax=Gnomoniopsis smithogilvyi TaxID=1191159 RepID=A0A9W8YQ57_9PEZI|nr:hypothetical protein N0V93_008498 [Gnomoniopsis smithogilvyi]
MPLRFGHTQGKRTSRGPVDESDGLWRTNSEMKDSFHHVEVGAGPSPEDEEMEGRLALDGPISCVQVPLSASSHSKLDLLHHLLQVSRDDTAVVCALGDVYLQRKELTLPTLFSLDSSVLDPDDYPSCEIYDVDRDSLIMVRNQCQMESHDDSDGSSCTWEMLKVRTTIMIALFVAPKLKPSLGRESRRTCGGKDHPSPTTFASIHLTMECHFDMDALLSYIISDQDANKGRTTSYMRKTIESRPFQQRTFLFVLKYYTVVDEGFEPSPWQRHGCRSSDRQTPNHVNISECSSVVGLSLERQSFGPPDPGEEHFAPFHVLNIRCFPDKLRSVHQFDGHLCYNGPYALLHCLNTEYQNAARRFQTLNESIAKLVLPSTDFIFDVKLRDKLLFEDADYTFSRRYFWAFNCLAMINDSIRSMINAYTGTFSDKFWLGKDQNLWPHPDPQSPEGRNYLRQLSRLRHGLEWSIDDLRVLIKSNDQLRHQIESLRDQLYSGSSVKENRLAIEQGENIKILTGVSMLFLPLSFVTSVYGMQAFTIPPNDWRFAVTMVVVCVPFFVLIFVLQTHAGMSLYRRLVLTMKGWIESWKRSAASRREKRTQLQQTETIRRQSCATTVVAGKRESTWNFDPQVAHGMAPQGLDSREKVRPWWKWSRNASKELKAPSKDLNV